MSDALYGIEVAHHHGLGLLWPNPADLAAHLAAEERYNFDAGGLKTMTGRDKPPPVAAAAAAHINARDGAGVATGVVGRRQAGKMRAPPAGGPDGRDDVVWEQSGPTWSYMAMALGSQPTLDAALAPAVRGADKWRSKL